MGHRIKGLIEIDEQRVALPRSRIKGFGMIQMISALAAGKTTLLDLLKGCRVQKPERADVCRQKWQRVCKYSLRGQ